MRTFPKYLAFMMVLSCVHVPMDVRRHPSSLPEGPVNSGLNLDPSKKTVCAITLNSDNEINTFKKFLGNDRFQYVELVESDKGWFKKALASKVHCDLLVVSAHFGGMFFGKNGRLDLRELEEGSCLTENAGFFRAPKEVFLFGCNTLAEKGDEFRSIDEYREVLLEDGLTPTQADLAASLLHSPVGSQFRSRMERVFAGVPRIYGFRGKGPAGNTAEAKLATYLSQFKGPSDYEVYLDRIDTQKNSSLFRAFSLSRIAQTSGASAGAVLPRCKLNNPRVPESEKVRWISKTLRDPTDRLIYLSEVGDYLLKHSHSPGVRNQELVGIHRIASDSAIKSSMNRVMLDTLKPFPFLRIQVLDFARSMGWIDKNELSKIKHEIFDRVFADGITVDEKDFLCSIGSEAGKHVTYDMAIGTLRAAEPTAAITALGCIQILDSRLQEELVRIMIQGSEKASEAATTALINIPLSGSPELEAQLSEVLSSPDISDHVKGRVAAQIKRLPSVSLKTVQTLIQALHNSSYRFIQLHASSALAKNAKSHVAAEKWVLNFLSRTNVGSEFYSIVLSELIASNYRSNELGEILVGRMKELSAIKRYVLATCVGALAPSPPEGIYDYAMELLDSSERYDISVAGILVTSFPSIFDPEMETAFFAKVHDSKVYWYEREILVGTLIFLNSPKIRGNREVSPRVLEMISQPEFMERISIQWGRDMIAGRVATWEFRPWLEALEDGSFPTSTSRSSR